MGALPCDAHHHYYHYQSSTQYLFLARSCFALGLKEEAMNALQKALFQDHFNEEALAMKATGSAEGVARTYAKHPLTDAEFCTSVGKQPNDATTLHDAAVASWQSGDAPSAITKLKEALSAFPEHANLLLTLGRILWEMQDYTQSRDVLKEAARLAHVSHDAYHRAASAQHLERARGFAAAGELDLAVNDFNKALDLHGGNEDAKKERAEILKIKNA